MKHWLVCSRLHPPLIERKSVVAGYQNQSWAGFVELLALSVKRSYDVTKAASVKMHCPGHSLDVEPPNKLHPINESLKFVLDSRFYIVCGLLQGPAVSLLGPVASTPQCSSPGVSASEMWSCRSKWR